MITDVGNNFQVCKNSSAPSIDITLWVATQHLDCRHENDSTPGVAIIQYSHLAICVCFIRLSVRKNWEREQSSGRQLESQ